MIPYDDLVAALQAWRARQGLPVNQLGGSGSGGTPSPGSGPHAKAGSGPNAKPGSGPNRGAPPAPPSSSRPNMAVAAMDDVQEADELIDEAAYENEGNDFAMAFGAGGNPDDATAIGGAPERPTEAELRTDDRDDW